MNILLPVDGSKSTKRMLAYIAAHKEMFGASHRYTVFTAVPKIPASPARHVAHAVLDDYYRDEAEAVFRPVREFAEQQHWNVEMCHAKGPAAECIAEQVLALRPDLIIMGSHGHSALGNLLMGSVATGVLARCKVPVLLVR
ncbi:universal stress protein [Roseateles sp.]|uniref:universal stress protein n=1 Tax=Roseateles sp. TaxID=1971397 RepID=UPI003266FADC